jgi:serine/threonine-protein kinase
MADVYLAVVEGPVGSRVTRLAVVKKLLAQLAGDREFIEMFKDEARVTSRLAHPNIVQIFDFGQIDKDHFLAMEFLDGQPLHRVVQRITRANVLGASIPLDAYYAVVSDVLAGLHYAHECVDWDGTPLSVVHRDVSPHNVIITYDGAVKLVDFGIAKAAGRLTNTEYGVRKGKIRYMSPEQAACRDVDRRTDVFAVGVMLWNLATGAKLWGELPDALVGHALFTGEYPRGPRELWPEVPEEIDAICRKALAPHPDDRYATAAEMRADLEAFLGRGAEVRTKLAATMKRLFEPERAKLKKILASSAIPCAVEPVGRVSSSRDRADRGAASSAAQSGAPQQQWARTLPR